MADGGGTVMVWMNRWGWWYYLKGAYLYNSVHCTCMRGAAMVGWADGDGSAAFGVPSLGL